MRFSASLKISLLFSSLFFSSLAHAETTWIGQDIGNVGAAGSSVNEADTVTLSGSGADIWNTADAFHFNSAPTTGNVVLIARVNSLSATNPWAKAGLMLRQNMNPDSPHVLLCVTPQNGLAFQRRLTTGTISQHTAVRSAALLAQTPAPWLKLERTGNLIKAWWSPNGTQWQVAGSLTVPWTDPLYAGLAVTSHQRGTLATAQFSNLSLSAAGIAPLPSPWLHQDLGNVTMSGFADYAGELFTVCGNGNDIWNTADAFHYAYQPLNGDGELIAQVTGPTATNPWAKAGLMIRETLTAESRHAMLVTTPANGLAWQRRLGTGANSQHRAILTAEQLSALPQSWLKVTRRGDLLTSFYSADGQTWTLAGTENLANLPTQIYLGLAVTAHRTGALSQADFSQVSFTPYPAMTLPAPWEQADIGAPGAQGMANSSNGSQFTLYGSGADIWGTADAFHYVYQTLPADGSIITQVTAQQNTNPWAKAGIMIRESLAPGSRHALLLLSPGNGIALQRRLTLDSTSLHTQVLKPATAPVWLKLQRSGTTVQAYRSIDGQTWISAGSVNLNTTGPLLMGLAVTSHQAGVINQSQFEHVSTTGGVPVIVDTDNDGLPDEWELAQFGNLNQNQTTDADSDGILDIDEYRTGTNPKDPPVGALPAAATNLQAIIQEDDSIVLTWTDNANNEDNYLIKRSDDGGQSWRLLATLPANTTTYTDRSGLLAQSKSAPSFWDFFKVFSLSTAWAQQSPPTYNVSPNNKTGQATPATTTAQPKSGTGGGTNPPTPQDRDGDGLNNEEDAVPDKTEMKVRAAVDANYAVISLGTVSSVGRPSGLNDRGEVLLHKNSDENPSYSLWSNGTLQLVTSESTSVVGPLTNGEVYIIKQQDGRYSASETIYSVKRHQWSNGSEDENGDYVYYNEIFSSFQSKFGTSAYTSIPLANEVGLSFIDTSDLQEKAYNEAITNRKVSKANGKVIHDPQKIYDAGYQFMSNSFGFDGIEVMQFDYYQTFDVPSVSPISGPKSGDFSSGAYGWFDRKNKSYKITGSYWSVNTVGYPDQTPDVRQESSGFYPTHINRDQFIIGVKVADQSLVFADLNPVTGCESVAGLTDKKTGEGPYILGKNNGDNVLLCYNGGTPVSYTLPAALGTTSGISNSLVIATTSSIWRNGKIRPLTELCGTGWTDFNIKMISPENNFLAGTAKSSTGAENAVLLLPVQLKDLKGAGDADDVTVAFRSSATDNSEANIAWIEPIKSSSDKTPRMPQLQVSIPRLPSGLKVQWKMENRYDRRSERDDLSFPDSDQTPYKVLPANEPWNIYSEYSNPDKFFGGDCTIFMTILDSDDQPITPEQKLKFRIRGKNPNDGDCKTHIVANQGAVWYAWAIAKHESSIYLRSNGTQHYYNQFNPPKASYEYEPNFSANGSDDGWGLFQRDTSSQVVVTTNETWSWDKNMKGFLQDEYPVHMRIANNYVDSIKQSNPNTFEEPKFTIEGNAISGRDVLAVTSYNGLRGPISTRLLFDGNKLSGNRWILKLPNAPKKDKPYVNVVLEEYNGG